MKKNICFTAAYCLLLLTTFTVSAQSVKKLYVNLSRAYGGPCSEYMDSIEYIPLETNKESLFGDIYQLLVTDSSYVISDIDTHSAFFFDKQGKFLKKVKGKEGTSVSLSFDETSGLVGVSLYDYQAGKFTRTYTTITGKVIEKVPNTTVRNLEGQRHHLGGGYYLQTASCYFLSNEKPKDSLYHLVNIFKDTTLYKSFIGYNQKENPVFCHLAYQPRTAMQAVIENGAMYICTPNDYYLYRVSKDTAVKTHQFVFPAGTMLPPAILTQRSVTTSYLDSLAKASRQEANIEGVSNIVFQGSRICFKTDSRMYTFRQGSESAFQHNFIYDTLTAKLVSLERLQPDSSNSFLPLMGDGLQPKLNGVTYCGDNVYSSVNGLQLQKAREANADKVISYPPSIQRFYAAGNRNANPVIVRMKLKHQ